MYGCVCMQASSAILYLSCRSLPLVQTPPLHDESVESRRSSRLYIDPTRECYAWWQWIWFAVLLSYVLPLTLVPAHAPFRLMSRKLSATQFALASVLPLPYLCNIGYWLSNKLCSLRSLDKDIATADSHLQYHALGEPGSTPLESSPSSPNASLQSSALAPMSGARAGVLDVLGRPYKRTHVWWQAILILVRLFLLLFTQVVEYRRIGSLAITM